MNSTFQHVAQPRNPIDWAEINSLPVDNGEYRNRVGENAKTLPLDIAARHAGMTEDKLLAELKRYGVQDVVNIDGVACYDWTDICKYLAKRDLGLLDGSKPKRTKVSRPKMRLY